MQSVLLVTDAVSTRFGLDLVPWSSGNFSEASRQFMRQLETAVYNSTVRLLGLLRVSVRVFAVNTTIHAPN
jgi:hypothetical protein